MKNFWNKIPALLKAIVLNLMLLYPVMIVCTSVIQMNTKLVPSLPWALPVVLLILFLYWNIVKRFNKGRNTGQISIELDLNKFGHTQWLKVFGLSMAVFAILMLSYGLIPVDNVAQFDYILAFQQLNIFIAIPLLLALSFMAGVVEEVTFRGIMQNTLQQKYSRLVTYFIVGVLFTLAHLLPLPMVVTYIVVSMLLSYVSDSEKSVAVNILSHLLVDFVIFLGIYFGQIQLGSTNTLLMIAYGLMLLVGLYFTFPKTLSSQKSVV